MTPTEQSQQLADQSVAEVMRREGIVPPCRRGCFHCCREAVYCMFSEVRLIVDSLSKEDRAVVAERTRAWIAKFLAAPGLADKTEPYMQDYRAQNLWCPLLKDGACMVYEKRPLSCRTHFALKSSEGCEDDAKRPSQKFAIFRDENTGEDLGTKVAAFRFAKLREGETETYDHLGILLGKRLLGQDVATAARVTWKASGGTLIVRGIKREREA